MAQSLFGQLLIRADGGASMGLGHVMRCLALAQAWQERGGQVTFLTTGSPSAFTERLQAEGMEWKAQPHLAGSQEDAAETAAVAGELAATCVVVDG